jgi:hypothetical protein
MKRLRHIRVQLLHEWRNNQGNMGNRALGQSFRAVSWCRAAFLVMPPRQLSSNTVPAFMPDCGGPLGRFHHNCCYLFLRRSFVGDFTLLAVSRILRNWGCCIIWIVVDFVLCLLQLVLN